MGYLSENCATEEDERMANELEEGTPLQTRFMIADLKIPPKIKTQ